MACCRGLISAQNINLLKATSNNFYNFCTNSNKWKQKELTADLSGSEVSPRVPIDRIKMEAV